MKNDRPLLAAWSVVALGAVAFVGWVFATQMSGRTRPLQVPSHDPKGVEAVNGRYGEPVEFGGRLWHVPPTSLVESGLGSDLIGPLVGAEAVSIAAAKEAKVLYGDFSGAALSQGDVWLFVPEQVLAWHGIVTVPVGAQRFAVTYSPLTETIAVYAAPQEMTSDVFMRTGYVWNNNDVFVDSSGAFILQATGEELARRENASASTWLPRAFDLLTFDAFQKAHPQGKVWMPQDTESIAYNYSPLGGYRESRKNIMFPLTSEWVRALPRKALVQGVQMDGLTKAYDPTLLARENRGVLTETVGEKRYVVWVGEDGAVRMHEAGQTVFKYASKGGLTDKLGYTWMVEASTGDLVRGSERFAAVPLLRSFWFFWSVLHPDTQLYASVMGKGMVNGVIDLKEEEGEADTPEGVSIDVDPSFGKGTLKVENAK
jgi:hypothetical protein